MSQFINIGAMKPTRSSPLRQVQSVKEDTEGVDDDFVMVGCLNEMSMVCH